MNDTPAEREDQGIWARLRRRKVVQWAVAYAAGAWVLLQVLDYAADAFAWPPITKPLAMLGAALGLPVALVLAWFHGERSEQRVTGRELAILTALLLVGGGLLWWYADRRAEAPASVASTSTPPPASATIDPRPSIAVLPFDNRSDEKKDAYFVDGIHDDILTQLSKVSALKVISRTSVEQFRDTKLSMRAIAEQLGVTKILEGGVQRGGERIRINVQLIDAGTDAHLWAETYDRELTAANIFAIQSELATAIARALETSLTPAEQARASTVPTQNLEAWEAYQLGLQRMVKRTSESLADAERFFSQAIALDPQFALAYAGLADTLTMQTTYSGKPPETTLAEADEAATRAFTLNPGLTEAWAASGSVALARNDYVRSERQLRRAVSLNPNYGFAQHLLGLTLRWSGRVQEGLEHSQRAVELDPLSVHLNNMLGQGLEQAGRFDDAAARYHRAIEIDPALPFAHQSLGVLAAYTRGQFVEAMPLVERGLSLDAGNPQLWGTLTDLTLDLGDKTKAVQLAMTSVDRWPSDYYANASAAIVFETYGVTSASTQRARNALAVIGSDRVSLGILRNADLKTRQPARALERYREAYPTLFESESSPLLDASSYAPAIDVSLVLQQTGDRELARVLLDKSEGVLKSLPRLGYGGSGISDVQIRALRGDKSQALTTLRLAARVGWRGPYWQYYRDIDPNLASIRNEPEFKAVFADIERDMARQRAALAARPKGAPLELAGTGT